MVVVIPTFFLLLFFLIFKNYKNSIIHSLIDTFIFTTLFIVLITELLGFFNALNLNWIKSIWLFAVITLFFLNYYKKTDTLKSIYNLKNRLNLFIISLNTIEKFGLISISILLILIFTQGIIYPPNNWDSLSYHLSRTIHWLNHNNIENFPSHTVRQMYQPSLCEYVILHVNATSSSDYFSNSVQFSYLIGTIITTIGLAKLFFSNVKYIPLLIIASTIPQALLEGSSTQNDLVHSFFIVTSVFYGIQFMRNPKIAYALILGITLGLALLSKAIAYVYLPILIGIVGVVVMIKILKSKNYFLFKRTFVPIILIIGINLPHSYRNFTLSGDMMGTDKKEKADYVNESFNPKFIFSTVLKNIGLHFDPFYSGNSGNIIVEKAHLIIDQDVNAKGSNVFDMKYNSNHHWKNHEDTQPNFIHFILFSLASIILLLFFMANKFKKNNSILILALFIIAEFIFFCAIITWEPWNTRLHLPLFFLSVPVIYFLLEFKKWNFLLNLTLFNLILYSFYVVIFNYSRPIINTKNTSKINISDNRFKKYFANQNHLYPEYKIINNKIKGNKRVGMIISNDTWEYPFYANYFENKISPIHLNVMNYSSKYNKNFSIDYIISNTMNQNKIIYNNKIYKNQTSKNKFIWLYK